MKRLLLIGSVLRSNLLRRILFGFGLVALILGVGLVVTERQFIEVNARFHIFVERDVRLVDDVESLMRLVTVLQSSKRGYVLTGDQEFLQRFDAARAAMRATELRVRTDTAGRSDATQQIDTCVALVDQYVTDSRADIALRQRADRGEVAIAEVVESARRTGATHAIQEAETILAAVHDNELRLFDAQRRRLEAASTRSRRIAVACMVLGLVVALLYGALLAGDIGAALASVRRSIEATARFEPREAPLQRDDEIGTLSRTFHEMTAQLTRFEAELREQVRAQQSTLEELREANEKLARAMRVKSDFLAAMSHELRTPLNAVIGLSALLLDSPTEQLSPRARQALQTMRGSGEHLLTLLNDILDLAKVDAGKMTFHDEPFDPVPLARGCVATVLPLLGERPIDVDFEARGNTGAALGDPQRVRQVLLNLLSNAVKFTDRGGVRVTIERVGERIALRVQDTGIGIAPEHLPALFEEFQQVAMGDTRPYGGTGLGLALSRRMARAMRGDISVESAQGAGSTFTLWLRAVAAPKETLIA